MERIKITLIAFLMASSFTALAQEKTEQGSNNKPKRSELGFSASTTRNLSVSYRLGSQRWYGIADLGTNFKEISAHVLGLGLGHSFPVDEKSNVNLEGLLTSYLYDGFNESMIDKGFELAVMYEYNLSDRIRINAGVTHSIIENHSLKGYGTKSLIGPLHREKVGNTNVGNIVGAKLGIYYRF